METLNKSEGVTLNSGLKLVLVGTIFHKFRVPGHSLSQATKFHEETVMNKVNCVALIKACTNTVTASSCCSPERKYYNNQCIKTLKEFKPAQEENQGGHTHPIFAHASQCKA